MVWRGPNYRGIGPRSAVYWTGFWLRAHWATSGTTIHCRSCSTNSWQLLGTSSGQLATGLEVLWVAPHKCGNKYRPRATDVPDEWLASLGLRAEEWQPQYGMGLQYYSAWLSRRGVIPNLDQILQDWSKLNNKTPSVDGMVVSLIKHFGLHAMQQLLRLLRTPLRDWPPESRQALHLVLHKKDGYNLNKDSRPIRLLSALFRVHPKVLCPHLQHAVRAPVSGGRQFAGYRGGSAIGMRRLVMLMLTQAVAVHGRVAMVLLDVAATFDEVSQHAILRASHQIDPTSWGIILQMLDAYTEIRTFVVTAYGLSEWYAQLGGVMQGGGGVGPPDVHFCHAVVPQGNAV